MVGSLGFVPSPEVQHRHQIVSSRSFSLFSFLGSFARRVKKSLAGDESYGSKNSQLPSLRQDVAWRVLERYELFDSENNQVPQVWQSEALERWEKASSFWRNAALLMSRLWHSFLEMVSSFSLDPSFSFFQSPNEDEIFEGASGRKCKSDCLEVFCFSNPKVYASCPARKEAVRKQS